MIVAREDDYGNKPLLDAPENTPPKDAKFTPNQTHIIPSEEGVGTVMGSTLNVANCAIGAGVLAFGAVGQEWWCERHVRAPRRHRAFFACSTAAPWHLSLRDGGAHWCVQRKLA